jgi:hypothetical protein
MEGSLEIHRLSRALGSYPEFLKSHRFASNTAQKWT